MKLATFIHGGAPRIGAVDVASNTVTDLLAAEHHPAFLGMQQLIEGGERPLLLARQIADARPAGATLPLADVTLLAPVPVPIQIRDFLVSEQLFRQGRERSLWLRCQQLEDPEGEFKRALEQGACTPPAVWYEQPIYYKANRFNVVGTGADVEIPEGATMFDYELEMGMFIGNAGRDIAREDARSHIFGYTVFNDLTARDFMIKEVAAGLGPAKGKDFDTGNAIGPWIVTADEIPDPYRLAMSVRVNGETRATGSLSDMHHKFEDMIAHVSRSETIHAGEFFGSGTIGNGSGHEHGLYLEPGDVVELEIEGIGTLGNRICAQPSAARHGGGRQGT